MPFFSESIFHDRQFTKTDLQSTSSSSFVDLIGASFTTTEIAPPSVYMITASILMSASLNNTIGTFRLLLDGFPVGDEDELILRFKDQAVGYTFLADLPDVSPGQVIQFQYKTDQGILTISENRNTIDGIPASRIIT